MAKKADCLDTCLCFADPAERVTLRGHAFFESEEDTSYSTIAFLFALFMAALAVGAAVFMKKRGKQSNQSSEEYLLIKTDA